MKVILLGDTNTDNTSIVLIGKDCKVIISEGCSIGGAKYGTKEVGQWIVDYIRKA